MTGNEPCRQEPGPLAAHGAPDGSRWVAWSFVAFMVLLSALCAGLGFWQLARLEEKQTLIARVEQRVAADPAPLPPPGEWDGINPAEWDFRPVRLTGRFAHDETILVFTSLSSPRGQASGPGYWVVTPMRLRQGGTVFVNRGFVPQALADRFRYGGDSPGGEREIVGLARQSERSNAFTPAPDVSGRVEWVRAIDRLRALTDPALAPYAPLYVDQAAGAKGALPQGGETRLRFTNRHLDYALTWFGLAAIVPVLTFLWLRHTRKTKSGRLASPKAGT